MTVQIETITGTYPMPAVSSAPAGNPSSFNVQQVSTVNANYMLAIISYNDTSNSHTLERQVSSVSYAGLTFTRISFSEGSYYPGGPNSTQFGVVEVWGAPITGGAISGQTMTVYSTSNWDGATVVAMGLTGVSATAPIDPNSSLPATGGAQSTANLIYSTSNSASTVFYVLGGVVPVTPDYGAPSGFTEGFHGGGGGAGSQPTAVGLSFYVPGSTVTNASVTPTLFGNGTSGVVPAWAVFAIAGATGVVPNIVWQLVGDANYALTTAGFTVGTATQVSSSLPPGTVLTQSTPAGTVESLPFTINYTYASGVIVPSVINQSLPVATATLAAAGFGITQGYSVTSRLVIPGNVAYQSPTAGTYYGLGLPVEVFLSSGAPPAIVPNVVGLTQPNADAAIQNAGLVVGAQGEAYSTTVPAGKVISQGITPGTAVAEGTLLSFVVSLGPTLSSNLFDYEATVISQYANSPTLLQLIQNFNQYFDQSQNMTNFYQYVWNVESAQGFGLDIWGKIVGVGRALNIPNTTKYIGFYLGSESPTAQDYTPMGSSAAPYNNPPVGGALYTGYNATTTYLLGDSAYRQLILAKAFGNIAATTAHNLNQILQQLFGTGQAYVTVSGLMAITYNLTFAPTPIQTAIITQSGVLPTPPGVAVTLSHP